MPADWADLLRTPEVFFTEGESAARTNDPCSLFPFCFCRYLESPLFARYVCGELFTVLHNTAFGRIGNTFGAHAWAVFVTRAAVSGIPTALPVESGQLTSSSGVCSSSAPVPTSAKSSEHALMMALRASLAFSFESRKSTCTLRPAMPPVALTYLPHPWTPSTMPCNTFGTIGLSTSVMIAMRMVLSDTPTSLWELPEFDCASAGVPVSNPATSSSAATNASFDGLNMDSPLSMVTEPPMPLDPDLGTAS